MNAKEAALKRLKDEMSRRGNLSWMNRPEQARMDEFVNFCLDKIKVLNVARQTGKTFYTAKRAIERGLKYDKQVMFYASAYYEDLRKFIHPTLEKVIENLPKDIQPKRKGNDYVFKNGSILYVVGVDKNPNAGRGNTIDFYVVDEAGFVKNLQYLLSSVVFPAMRQANKKYIQNPKKFPKPEVIIPSTPPESPEHYFRELSMKAQKDKNYFLMNILDTTATEEEIEEYRSECSTSPDFEREYMCRFVTDDAKAVLPGFGPKRSELVQNVPRPKFYNQHTSADHGHKDQTGIVIGHWDVYGNKIVIEDSISLIRPLTSQIATAIKEIEKKHYGAHPQYRPIDSSPQVVADLCSEFDCIVNKVSLNKKMRDRMLRLRQFVEGGIIVINDTPNNKILADQMEYALWKDPITKLTFEHSSIYGHYDLLAALGYFIDTIDTTSNPKPNDYGIDYVNDMILDMPDYNKDNDLDNIGAGFTNTDISADINLI